MLSTILVNASEYIMTMHYDDNTLGSIHYDTLA